MPTKIIHRIPSDPDGYRESGEEFTSHYDLSIGYADDPRCKWEGGNYDGNIPNVVVGLGSISFGGSMDAMLRLESPKWGGKQLDWGACGARLTKERIGEFLREFAQGEQWLQSRLALVEPLDKDRLYILFASES